MGNELEKYENEYDKSLVRNGSVLGLVSQMMELDDMKPYLEVSSDTEIKNYFEKKGIKNVTNKKGLESFYNYLNDKIAELADSSDERAKLYFEKREYLKQLEALPKNLSKLEQTVSDGFEALKTPFKAVMNYVWDSVMNNGFEMKENGKDALEKYEGKLKIENYSTLVRINWINENKFKYDISKIEIEEKNVWDKVRIFKFIPFIKKEIYKTIKEERKSKDFFVCGEIKNPKGKRFPYNGNCIEESIFNMQENFISYNYEKSDEFQKECFQFIKIILNLPKIMENYVKRKQGNFTKMFDELRGVIENGNKKRTT